MKGILEYDLPEEEAEFTFAKKAIEYQSVVWQFNEFLIKLRNKGPEYFGLAKEISFEKGVMFLWRKWIELCKERDIDPS